MIAVLLVLGLAFTCNAFFQMAKRTDLPMKADLALDRLRSAVFAHEPPLENVARRDDGRM